MMTTSEFKKLIGGLANNSAYAMAVSRAMEFTPKDERQYINLLRMVFRKRFTSKDEEMAVVHKDLETVISKCC